MQAVTVERFLIGNIIIIVAIIVCDYWTNCETQTVSLRNYTL